MASINIAMDSSDALISFGDSFTWGTELSDCDETVYSQNTWPALCARNLGVEYRCLAMGGTGNQKISYEVLKKYNESIRRNRNFYVINWTWIGRFDYIDSSSTHWKTIHPHQDDEIAHFFYRHIDDENWNLIRNLQTIYSTIQFLESNDCGFLMTCLDDTLLGKNYLVRYTPTISTLQSLVRPHIHKIENQNFLDWSKSKGFPIGTDGHPLEKAHACAAEFYLEKLKSRLRVGTPK